MCGILGTVGTKHPAILPLELLQHRGPDHQGYWTNGKTCTLGHTRLSIIDLDARANQPMSDPTGRFTIVYNGEIYNYRELAKDYLNGITLKTSSDTEVLLRLWEKYGVDCLRHLRGMFAFAIWDEKEQILYLTRDHFGKKPLFLYYRDDSIVFASELDALIAMIDEPLRVDPAAIDLFFGYQFIPCPLSIYKNVRKLPPAHYATWKNGQFKLERYWHLKFEPKRHINGEEAIDELDERVRESTTLRMHADVKVGVLLSGGVDSSLITALAAQRSEKALRTFTVGFVEKEFDERSYAEQIAHRYGTEHHTVVMDFSCHELLQEMVTRYGEPYADKSALPTLAISRLAAKDVKVVLVGDGGDELFAGYSKYLVSPLLKWIAPAAWITHRLGTFVDHAAGYFTGLDQELTLLRRMISPYSLVLSFDHFIKPCYRAQLYQNDFFFEVRGARSQYESQLVNELPLPNGLLDQMLSLDYRHYLTNDLLVKMDIGTMTYSLEARAPLLDHTLFEFAASLPEDMKINMQETKYLLKRVATRYLPRDVVYRPKQGFSVPISKWIKTHFASLIRDLCGTANHPLWEYCRRQRVEKWLVEHLNGQIDHGFRLWLVLILGIWMDRKQKK